MNLSAQEYLAKLLAKENLTIQHGNYSTASFEPVNRVLRLPLWADKGKDVYDLLVGHEVGHALFTPVDGWHDADKKIGKIPRAYLNIVEDIRIERKIQERYPGIVRRFKAGYTRLFDDNLFGTDDRDINEAGLMDRLNVSSKGRGYIPVEFSNEESPLVKEAMAVETWNDVVKVCKKFYDFIEENKEEKEEEDDMPMEKSDGNGEPDESSESSMPGDEPSDDEGKDGEDGEGESGSEKGDSEKEEREPGHETFTDDAFRENEEELLEKKEDRYEDEAKQSAFSSGISDVNLNKILYSYKDANEMRIDYIEEMRDGELEYTPYLCVPCKDDWIETKMSFKSQASLIAKDFERKKAAYEYSRAKTAKTGKIDPLKMHAYKYSEDIFLTTTQLAQAKSHGIMMFLDLSGSMCDIIEDVVAQATTIAMFCRQVNVPFEAYSFTTSAYWRSKGEGMREIENGPSEMETENVKIVEMFSSKMNKKTFEEAAYTMFAIGKAHSYNRNTSYHISSNALHALDQMGSTPLIQTCFLAARLTNAFTKKHAIQNANILFLTDGCPDGVRIAEDKSADVKTHTHNKMINFDGKMLEGSNSRDIYEKSLSRLRELTGATLMGFHLASDASTFGSGLYGVNTDIKGRYVEFSETIKSWRKEGFSEWKNSKGYDNYFIIKINKSARFDSDEFTPKKVETINDLKREFKKFNKTKKGNKQLVARITDAVTA